MKKHVLKQAIIALVLVVVTFSATETVQAADVADMVYEVSPRYENISSFTFSPSIDGHYVFCSAKVSTRYSYNVEVIVELQKRDGGWSTVDSWSDNNTSVAYVSNVQYYIVSGALYRFRATANIYDSRGNLLESTEKYSSIMSC